jgi:hypothetical protein
VLDLVAICDPLGMSTNALRPGVVAIALPSNFVVAGVV